MSLATFTKQHPHGPVRKSKLDLMGIRFMLPPAGDEGFTAPASQEELDKLINKATAKVHERYKGFDDIKAKAEKADDLESELATLRKPEPKPKGDDIPTGLAPEEVDKRINDAIEKTRAEDRAELALERATDALDKALTGRTFEPGKVLTLDRTKFVKDGAVDAEAIKEWVEANSTEAPKPRTFDRGQGERDGSASGGSVQAGRDAYKPRSQKK